MARDRSCLSATEQMTPKLRVAYSLCIIQYNLFTYVVSWMLPDCLLTTRVEM